jgi:hypothetical protein
MELLSTWCCAAAFFSASGAALLQEVADGKINVQSACAPHTQYIVGESFMSYIDSRLSVRFEFPQQ